MSWILTYSGVRFDLRMPTAAMIRPIDIAHALSHVARFNGHTAVHYSVAQHSLLVCDLVQDPALKLQALLHDATEAYVGDMVRPLKEVLPEYRQVEARIWQAVCEHFGLEEQLAPEVKHADLVALATERRDLMPADPVEWPCLQGIEPHPEKLLALPSWTIRDRYFQRLLELMHTTHRARVLSTWERVDENHTGATAPQCL
ncbi:phosphohydrolase [Stutzerimonas nosocomialis]|uniref:Phosphohydrolase n=1 Tax=Stutzerimonas nosocomialis TaxID=1056496 RepID=A0A5R9QJF1_9GAMM|nr:phosphohydrolase [Stutzerimonas nosocomialis]TLX65102.1 phosphohydrolase [Stutzerimonas nosocomialis]